MTNQALRDPYSVVPKLNTTPLIDVMLVLLVMFIIAVPLQTHAVKIDIPSGPSARIDPVRNLIVVTRRDAILWNGTSVDIDGLRANLAAAERLQPTPELHLRPEADARYALVDEVLVETKRAQVTRMGFVGNEAYARF